MDPLYSYSMGIAWLFPIDIFLLTTVTMYLAAIP